MKTWNDTLSHTKQKKGEGQGDTAFLYILYSNEYKRYIRNFSFFFDFVKIQKNAMQGNMKS